MENGVSRDTQSALSSDRSLFANRSKKRFPKKFAKGDTIPRERRGRYQNELWR